MTDFTVSWYPAWWWWLGWLQRMGREAVTGLLQLQAGAGHSVVTSSAAERTPSDVTPRCFRELDSIMFYSEGRHSPVPGNCVPARPAPSPPLLPRAGVPRLGPGPGPEQRRRARCILGTPAPHPRPAAPLLYCQGLSSPLIIPSPAAEQGWGWGWGWMLKRTKNKMLHFFADVHCTSKQ